MSNPAFPTPTRKLQVYPASRLCHADRWLDLDTGLHWCSIASWPTLTKCLDTGTASPAYLAREFWVIDIKEALASDVVMVYGELNDEPLRGALVEAGAKLGNGGTVVAVGDKTLRSWGSWVHHPKVVRLHDLVQFNEWARLKALALGDGFSHIP